MTPDQVHKMVQYRMQQAQETIHESEVLIGASAWRGAINRAYYAMFYAVLALAVIKQVDASKHSGAISFFDREYVKSGIFPKELSRSLHFAFERRQMHDYGEIARADQSESEETLRDAKVFVAAIEDYLVLNIYPTL
jgi:uncharacterized protein (UPF0332 family)